MRELKGDLRIGILGAVAGLFTSSVTLLIARINSYYDYLSWIAETDHYYERGVEDLWWMPLAFWHILLSVAAALLVHRYLRGRVRSPFLLWQIVGMTALLGWGLTFAIGLSLSCVMRGDVDLAHTMNVLKLDVIEKYVSAAFACNVFYGSVMNASCRQYSDQWNSQIARDGRDREALHSYDSLEV